MLSADQLTSMRATVNAALPDTATILRDNGGSDNQGGKTENFASVGTCACRLFRAGTAAQEGERGGEIASTANWTALVPYNTNITTKDRLQVGARVFSIIGLDAPRTWELYRRLELEETSA